MDSTPLLIVTLVLLVVATGLLGWIARLLYTWRERYPVSLLSPPPDPYWMPRSLDLPPPEAPERPVRTDAPVLEAPPPTAPPPPPEELPTTGAPMPLFYEYTNNGLIPVDPYRAPLPEERLTPDEAAASGDSDGRVRVEDVSPEEEGFVWL